MTNRPKSPDELLRIDRSAEFCKELGKEPGIVKIEQGAGSCVKFYGPKGMVPVHNHPTQAMKYGTRRGIVKMAVLAGIFGTLVLVVITPFVL